MKIFIIQPLTAAAAAHNLIGFWVG